MSTGSTNINADGETIPVGGIEDELADQTAILTDIEINTDETSENTEAISVELTSIDTELADQGTSLDQMLFNQRATNQFLCKILETQKELLKKYKKVMEIL